MNLTKKTLADEVAAELGITKKDSAEVVNCVFETIANTLSEGDTVDIAGFGKFVVKDRAARKGINPLTKEQIDIPATKVPSFKAGKALKDRVK